MIVDSSERSNDSAVSTLTPVLMMEQLTRISISDLTQLLEKRVITRGILTFKVAPTRHVCNIDDCVWQSSDIIELDSHVQECHSETSRNIDHGTPQVVFSELELQKLAVEGTAIIEGNSFEIVQPVRFLFSIHGGRWYAEGTDRIYDTVTQLSAKEAQLLEELEELRSEHKKELAKRDEAARAEQEVSQFARSRIEQLEREIAEVNATTENSPTDCSATCTLNEEEPVQELVASDACVQQNMSEIALVSPTDLQGKVMREFADIIKGVMEHWVKDQAKQKGIIQMQSDKIAAHLQQISKQNKELRIKNVIIEAVLPVYQRFFVRAEKGHSTKPTMLDSSRDARHKSTISKGNDAAHRANFEAHLCLWNDQRLNSVDSATFEKMYGFHPKKYASMLRPANLVEMYNMMGTMAAIPYRLKFNDNDWAAKYKDFMARAEAVAKIRDTFNREKGKEQEASVKCGSDPSLLENLEKMKVIYKMFLEYDKTDREKYLSY